MRGTLVLLCALCGVNGIAEEELFPRSSSGGRAGTFEVRDDRFILHSTPLQVISGRSVSRSHALIKVTVEVKQPLTVYA